MKRLLLLFFCFHFLSLPEKVSAADPVPILIYHSIDEYNGHGSKELYVTPENFEKQMTYLRDHGFTLLTFERWQERKRVNKPIFLTFDDGYKNNLTVFSIFQKLKTDHFSPTGTFFIISDFIGRSNRLSKTDLRRLAESGVISVQSHTATHPDLTKVDNLDYELKKSKEKIEKITGKAVIALSYPYGSFNNQVVSETKKHYQFGLTTIPGPFSEIGTKNELYLLPRTYIKYSTSLADFVKIVEGNKH
ncbi:polysaccharide deacetylase family protein [Neobacillus sp. NPDC058068]|uniref:polysaccharide deacetylase family protein n=1 Tax=Neobacillus sp. NPDC058068 TaxID=3346325 RepID=UPI0036DD44CB